MKNKIKNIIQICLLLVLGFVLLTACSKEPSENLEEGVSLEQLEAVGFEDLTVDYNGIAHTIKATNVPEGVNVRYDGDNQVEPGTYTITVTLTSGDLKVVKTATLTINPLESVLEAPANQTVVLNGNTVALTYTLNNDKQPITYVVKENGEVKDISALYKYGTYEVELYAKAMYGYKESNHVNVVVEVVESAFGLSFDSKTFTYDGTEKSISVDGDLPDGYSVEYTDNKKTEAGDYFAFANILDETGNSVEVLTAVLSIENPENEDFAKYLDEFFVEYLEGDQLAINIFCEDAEKFGLERYEAKWYTYEAITEEDIEHDLGIFKEMLSELEVYKDSRLSELQEVAYRTVEDFLTDQIKEYEIEDSFFMRTLYVDQFGGYVADFGTYMESYSLREEADVKDIVSYIESTKDAFPSYLVYLEEKTEKGYALSDFTVASMRNYLAEILGLEKEAIRGELPEEEEKVKDETDEYADYYYLVGVLCNKIDGLEFLKEEQKTSYKNQIITEMEESFIAGVRDLYEGLEAYKGKLAAEDEGYLTVYEGGKDYYLFQLESLLGIEEFDPEAYIEEVVDFFDEHSSTVASLQSKIVRQNNISTYEELEKYLESQCIYDATPEEMIEYLKEFAKTIVPELETDPEIHVKEMDKASAKVSNAVAYYMKSAIDNTAGEYITLNPLKVGGKNDVLSTMAHEGYPGHLYAYVRSKELGLSNAQTVMTSTAHGEGWATYVQIKLFEYAKENSTDSKFRSVMDYYIANDYLGHILETRLDIGILYEGWSVNDVAIFLNDNGYNSGAAQEIYDLIIEMPSTYAAYGYGKMYFLKLHEEAKDILGYYYDEIEFNDMLLSRGWTDLDELKNTYMDYMAKKCHEVNVEFESNI